MEYYFDTETTGTDPTKHKIITIQWQLLDRSSGEPVGELQILKEWESSEKEILKEFLPKIQCDYRWNFIAIGKNLLFDFNFLDKRIEKWGLTDFRRFDLAYCQDRVFLDLKHPIVLMNNSQFVGYNEVLDKDGSLEGVNAKMKELYDNEKYDEIIDYIKKEAGITIEAFKMLKKHMPSLRKHL
jgi:uncharacterized protein YprB with RNaseH-like and TPR domain